MTSKTEPKDEGPRSFSIFLQQLADGHAHVQLSEKLHELLRELHDDANRRAGVAKGRITLVVDLKVECEPSNVVGIKYDIAVKTPKRENPPGLFWLTPGKNLDPNNPRQQALPFRDVKRDEPAPKDATKPEQPAIDAASE